VGVKGLTMYRQLVFSDWQQRVRTRRYGNRDQLPQQ